MIAYKFLASGSMGPFSRFRWRPGEWVEAVRAGEGWGIHACRPRDLAWWINAELWRVDLEGPLHERTTQIEGRRGRLLDRIREWNEKARADFGLDCVFQTRDVSVSVLRKLGVHDVAERLAAARTLPQLLEAATSVPAPPGFAGEMFGYAHDAAGAYTVRANAAEASFMASVATAA
ncbi:MAG TPA: hypothetical protein VG496_07075, partial [Myxococcales bacterium]|nr:hypothetical protein [Myxococcales bacterium]